MSALILAAILALTVHVEDAVDDMSLVIVDPSGTIVEQLAAPEPGDYVFENLEAGSYTIQAMASGTILASVAGVRIPDMQSVQISVAAAPAPEESRPAVAGARRNQNIQVNLVDNQALNEALGRQGAQVRPVTEFSVARGNYAAGLGGIGRDPSIVRGASPPPYRGEVYLTHNNHTVNARTFFQVDRVRPSRRNQYGFRLGGTLGSDRIGFTLNAEETRESGFVNGNVLVPLAEERTALAPDSAVRGLIQSWLDAYPAEAPNRPEIDPRLLNTNALQTIRNSGGAFRLDWEPRAGRRFSVRYSLNDNFIDSFEFVVGQNPNQRVRPQNLSLAWEQTLSPSTTLRLGANYIRRKVDVLVPPGSVGPFVNSGRDFQALGPMQNFPVHRVTNDFQYLAQGATRRGRHQLDWGVEWVRTQINEFQSDGARGNMNFGNNFGRTAIENFRLGTPSRYSIVLGELYRGFRLWETNLYLNDRIELWPGMDLTLGLRYEFRGAPDEVNDLTTFPYEADANNFAPRVGLAWSSGRTVVRAGYGIAYGDVFPATFRVARLNPPEIVRVDVRNPNVLDPLGDFQPAPGETPRSSLRLIDPDLVTPYMHQYALQIERELAGNFRLAAAYMGTRNWKLFRNARENRAARVEGMPLTTGTINLRRPDQRFFSVSRMTNQGRAYFDAAEMRVDKVFSRGVALAATYTFSKALGTAADFSNTATGRDERRAQIEEQALVDLKSRSRFDAPHAFVFVYSWGMPRWMGGFTLAGTTILKDGTPFSVETGTDAPPFGNVDGERNDRPSILDPSLLGRSVDDPDTALGILRRDAFDASAAFREGRGNLSRGVFRKDGTTNFNVALSRAFALSQDRSLLVRTELINAFNHPQFDRPNTNLSSPAFGQITNTLNAGRIVQFHVRMSF